MSFTVENINTVTKNSVGDSGDKFEYDFPAAVIRCTNGALGANGTMTILPKDVNQETQNIKFIDIVDDFGTSNIEGYVDELARRGFFFDAASEPKEFNLELSKGNIDGHSSILKFGENPDIDSASGFETIWDAGGVYVPPTIPRIHDMASTSALDTGSLISSGIATSGSLTSLVDTGATFITDGVAAGDLLLNDSLTEIAVVTAVPTETELTLAGEIRNPWDGTAGTPITTDVYRVVTNGSTGASLVAIDGLDTSILSQSEFVVLNGTINVATVKTWYRQFRMRAFGANATKADGTLTSTAQTDNTITCQLINGNNQSLMAIYTIPNDKTGYLTKFWGALSKKGTASVDIVLRAGTLDGFGYHIHNEALNSSGSSRFSYIPTIPMIIPKGVDIWVEADTDTNNTGVAAGFDLILVDL